MCSQNKRGPKPQSVLAIAPSDNIFRGQDLKDKIGRTAEYLKKAVLDGELDRICAALLWFESINREYNLASITPDELSDRLRKKTSAMSEAPDGSALYSDLVPVPYWAFEAIAVSASRWLCSPERPSLGVAFGVEEPGQGARGKRGALMRWLKESTASHYVWWELVFADADGEPISQSEAVSLAVELLAAHGIGMTEAQVAKAFRRFKADHKAWYQEEGWIARDGESK